MLFTNLDLLARCAIPSFDARLRYRSLRSNLIPSLQVAVSFNPQSIPILDTPSLASTSTLTVTLKYQRPLAS